jgi:hypothetical protein
MGLGVFPFLLVGALLLLLLKNKQCVFYEESSFILCKETRCKYTDIHTWVDDVRDKWEIGFNPILIQKREVRKK